MIYGISEKPPLGKLALFSVQMMLSVFVATVLIANICGVDVGAALVGASLSTIAYGLFTKRQSPMFISNSGAFVAPVLVALMLGGYTGVFVGGITTFVIYCIFGLIFSKISVDKIYTIFPASLIGAVTAVIGLNLMGFIPTYIQINGETNQWGLIVALFTMCIIAVVSHYAKGIGKLLPFLIGTLSGYVLSVVLTLTHICNLVDFTIFKDLHLFRVPTFAFMIAKNEDAITKSTVISIVIMYVAYTVSAMMECLSDHAALGGIIGTDLYKKPGLSKIFVGEGVANLVGSFVGGLGQCSYGEGVATVGFSKVASRAVVTGAAIILGLMGFIMPVQVFIESIPSCVFGGCAMILYGFITVSGIKMLKNVDLDIQKNLIIVSTVLSIGVSGVVLGNEIFSFSGTALALIVGVILNLILKENVGAKNE